MAKPETPAEEQFLKLLDDYCMLLSGQEHIGFSDEDELRRALVWYNTEDIRTATRGLIDVLTGFTKIFTTAPKGAIRPLWSHEFKEVLDELSKFGSILHSVHELRYH